MKKTILLLTLSILFSTYAFAARNCFIAMENNQTIRKEGDCASRHAPCSTFKIAISLMAYNERLLVDETQPELPFQKGYVEWLENWKQSHTPRLWLKNSCVWYSQILTQKLGMTKFKEYVKQFNYGNHDVPGDKGKDNGLTHAWLSSSLEISPQEQSIFLQKLLENKLPVSLKAHEMTRNILFIEELPNGWKLYGKTGNGSQLNNDRTQKLDLQLGWFIGWIKKDERIIIFVNFIEDNQNQDNYASFRVKADAKEKLAQIVRK